MAKGQSFIIFAQNLACMQYINIHTHKQNKETETISVVNASDCILTHDTGLFSCGIHPWRIQEQNYTIQIRNIQKTAKNSNVVAIGECGLDKIKGPALSLQLSVLHEHVQIASTYNKPLILHCVKSYSELIHAKKSWPSSVRCIIHGFRKNKKLANQLIESGFYLSFGEAILYQNSLTDCLQSIPKDKVFLETDDSEIDIKSVYNKLTEIWKMPLFEVQQIIRTNFNSIL